jgi:hypothetical protein
VSPGANNALRVVELGFGARIFLAASVVLTASAQAQTELGVALDGVDGAAAMNALGRECYEAGLTVESAADSRVDCSAIIEERTIGSADDSLENANRIVVRHKLRFMLLTPAGEAARIRAEAWTETEEFGSVIEQPLTSQDYRDRVAGVLTAVVERLASREAPAWTDRYESEQAWHLDAHVRAVSYCDANLTSMSSESVAAELARIGSRPIDEDTRDRCEQLYTQLFEWGLARGNESPSVAEYVRYREALPPKQRICSGQLALDATCDL